MKKKVSDDEPEEFRRKRDEEFEHFFQVEYAAKQKILSDKRIEKACRFSRMVNSLEDHHQRMVT
jgi:uncharacterized protein YaeQ